MGNRHAARADEFDWRELGIRRRLRRYVLEAGLTYGEIALLLGTSAGSVAGAVMRYDIRLSPEEQADRKRRQSWERAKHGRRGGDPNWDARLTETWNERKARKAREKAKADAAPA